MEYQLEHSRYGITQPSGVAGGIGNRSMWTVLIGAAMILSVGLFVCGTQTRTVLLEADWRVIPEVRSVHHQEGPQRELQILPLSQPDYVDGHFSDELANWLEQQGVETVWVEYEVTYHWFREDTVNVRSVHGLPLCQSEKEDACARVLASYTGIRGARPTLEDVRFPFSFSQATWVPQRTGETLTTQGNQITGKVARGDSGQSGS